jgi:hypothetical protein
MKFVVIKTGANKDLLLLTRYNNEFEKETVELDKTNPSVRGKKLLAVIEDFRENGV